MVKRSGTGKNWEFEETCTETDFNKVIHDFRFFRIHGLQKWNFSLSEQVLEPFYKELTKIVSIKYATEWMWKTFLRLEEILLAVIFSVAFYTLLKIA